MFDRKEPIGHGDEHLAGDAGELAHECDLGGAAADVRTGRADPLRWLRGAADEVLVSPPMRPS